MADRYFWISRIFWRCCGTTKGFYTLSIFVLISLRGSWTTPSSTKVKDLWKHLGVSPTDKLVSNAGGWSSQFSSIHPFDISLLFPFFHTRARRFLKVMVPLPFKLVLHGRGMSLWPGLSWVQILSLCLLALYPWLFWMRNGTYWERIWVIF